MTCVGCKWYEPEGVQRGPRKYSKCNRAGAKELAAEERQSGACGPEATLKE